MNYMANAGRMRESKLQGSGNGKKGLVLVLVRL